MTQEILPFQAEVKQLLHIVSHALYSQRDIFLRELLSNASDACEKLRYESLANPSLIVGELYIEVSFDAEQKTITISDNGIGMSREEVIKNLGVIARSGTREFMSSMKQGVDKTSERSEKENGQEGKHEDATEIDVEGNSPLQTLIGQFGVGFYSSFIVANRVEVVTCRSGTTSAVRWASSGEGEFAVEDVPFEKTGLSVILHLKKEHQDLLEGERLREIILHYSDHICQPVYLKAPGADRKQINQAAALWIKQKSQITDEQYREFYKHIAHDFQDPLTWTHARLEGRTPHIQLLYLPSRLSPDVREGHFTHGIKLYVRRVFVMEDNKHLLPSFLRFVRGVVDVEDLPLNISREILQESRDVDFLRSSCTRRVLSLLEDLASKEPAKFNQFWDTFGLVFKEGIVEDEDLRKRIANLIRFYSTHEPEAMQQRISLAGYLSRMKENQEHIYYLSADHLRIARTSPQLEALRRDGIEVLLLTDRIDEWVVAHLLEYEGKNLQSVARGDFKSPLTPSKDNEQDPAEGIIKRLKENLQDKVSDVRASHRLVDSPCCLVDDDKHMSRHLAQLLEAAGQKITPPLPVLEINVNHPLISRLSMKDQDFADWAAWLLDQAILSEGGELPDPANSVRRLNKLLLEKS